MWNSQEPLHGQGGIVAAPGGGAGIVRVDENSGATTLIGPPIPNLDGLSSFGDGQVFGATRDGTWWKFYEVNPFTGEASHVNSIAVSVVAIGTLRAFEMAPTGEVYFISRNAGLGPDITQLWMMPSIHSDTATLLNGFIPGTQSLAYGPDGKLYGFSNQVSVGLYTIDTATGDWSPIGGSLFAQGMAFGPDGTLYAQTLNQLFTVDPLTGGILESFRPGSIGDLRGLAYIPTPSTMAICMVTVALANRRRR